MNAELRKNSKNDFKKDVFELMNSTVFVKTMENVRRHRDLKILQPKQEELIWCQNHAIVQQIFFLKIYF